MSIPLAMTTITVLRVVPVAGDDSIYDPYDPVTAPATAPAMTTIASGVRATIGTPSASVMLSGGDRVVYSAQFMCDITPILAEDTIVDAAGTTWVALWARPTFGLGLDHTQGELRLVTGAA